MRVLPVLCCLPIVLAAPAFAANLCVNQSGAPGCYTTISSAVAAAAPSDVINVNGGTYYEDVVITKPLSIVGNYATVDATGKLNGFFVNGLATPGLAGVHISGFTVRNAELEGILLLNVSNVTLSANTVTGNDQALKVSADGAACDASLLPLNEQPGEFQDCGEGIHLQAVDHSIITGNTVQGNSGGILITDDSGPTHDNVITFNTVTNNPYACGITLASHATALTSTPGVLLGVYHNTVYGNKSTLNGLANGGGAGVGFFTGVPGGSVYANVAVDNYLAQNGLPGVALHLHIPNTGSVLNDNVIVGNTIVGNSADTADAFTPGPTGINIYAASSVTGTMITGNSIQGESYDVVIKDPGIVPAFGAPATQIHFNGLLGLGTGVLNAGLGTVDATNNWWSCPNGPYIPGSCSLAAGPSVAVGPWLQTPIPQQPNY